MCDVSLKYVTSTGLRGKGDLQNFAALEVELDAS